ncbi:hypothetical protein A3754_09165 [Alcanivorax sp. HI0083]|nr:hypothetical protein A3730_17305 [Alcanivorax sp. HI0044]KZY36365.1 hypothetical protein A3730_29030 [Alcanivorax sp. HI0044]KZZ26988.1 hypothetical protein A3754_09165 [Alcanivorax sp. HI0083]PHR67745.1 MAG: hypothetical protein COA55_05385 [Alcanivorax sp.]
MGSEFRTATSYKLQVGKFLVVRNFYEAAVGVPLEVRTALARKSPAGRSGVSKLDGFQKEWRKDLDLCRLARPGSHLKRCLYV